MKAPLISDFDYGLPPELIAQKPALQRQDSRLMVISRQTGSIEDRKFTDLKDYLQSGDALVLNDTRVLPVRFFGDKASSLSSRAPTHSLPNGTAPKGAVRSGLPAWLSRAERGAKRDCFAAERGITHRRVEVLLIRDIDDYTWEVLLRPVRGLKKESVIKFEQGLEAVFKPVAGGGLHQLKFNKSKDEILKYIQKFGFYPVPPYIKRNTKDKKAAQVLSALDKERYQTVFAKEDGAIAAPTAGLHFSRRILKELEGAGIEILYVTLHVGYGTFQTLRQENIDDEKLHPEFCSIPARTFKAINRIKRAGGKVTVVGTTVCRALETAAKDNNKTIGDNKFLFPEKDFQGWTELFIYPGFDFKVTDRLLTNFHFPGTSLLMLVSAFCGDDIGAAGPGLWRKAYQQAIEQKYRFYSYGDAMLIC